MRHGTRPARSLLAVAVVAAVLVPAAATASYARVRQAGAAVKVEGTTDNKFVPKDIQATAGADGKVTIEFTSKGAHTIQSDEVKGFDSGAVNNETKTITFEAKPGTYAVYCLYHKSIGMTGTLTVAAGGGGEPAGTTAPTASAEPTESAPAETVAPTAEPAEDGGDAEPAVSEDDPSFHVPGVADNPTLVKINRARDAEAQEVSGFKFFTFGCIAFLFILGAAVLFSTKPRRSGR